MTPTFKGAKKLYRLRYITPLMLYPGTVIVGPVYVKFLVSLGRA